MGDIIPSFQKNTRCGRWEQNMVRAHHAAICDVYLDVLVLGSFEGEGMTFKLTDVLHADEKTTLCYFRKRITCSCLDEKRKQYTKAWQRRSFASMINVLSLGECLNAANLCTAQGVRSLSSAPQSVRRFIGSTTTNTNAYRMRRHCIYLNLSMLL